MPDHVVLGGSIWIMHIVLGIIVECHPDQVAVGLDFGKLMTRCKGRDALFKCGIVTLILSHERKSQIIICCLPKTKLQHKCTYLASSPPTQVFLDRIKCTRRKGVRKTVSHKGSTPRGNRSNIVSQTLDAVERRRKESCLGQALESRAFAHLESAMGGALEVVESILACKKRGKRQSQHQITN